MPAAYFRGDTHYQITVKRSGKTDFYVIPSRDRNLADERHVIGVYARILENFPANEGYVVSLEKYDGEPRKEKVEIPKLAANVCAGQLSRIKRLLAEAEVAWKAIEPLIDNHKDQINKAINIQIKIAKLSYPFPRRGDHEEYAEREKLEQELKEIVPFQEMLRLYKEYSSCMFSVLRELSLLRFYNKEDSDAYLQPMHEFGSIKDLLRSKGFNNVDEVDPFAALNHLNDTSDSLSNLRRSILNSKEK
jgi:hypothetical protein